MGCSCDCSAIFYEGNVCEIKTPCDITDIKCLNGGKNIGVKVANNCRCDCSQTKYYGKTCQNEIPCYNTDNPKTVDFKVVNCLNGGFNTGTIVKDNCECDCTTIPFFHGTTC